MREEFEAWHHAEFGYVIAVEDDPQQDGQCAKRWKAWQASRAALRVELPERRDPLNSTGDDENPRSAGFNDCLERVTEALQQAGIEVKHGTA
ncbi:TPA: hypothetical protein ND688_003200 [Pseudomonas aeruginosa]|uniref:hypothetical protein n=1 Tax=Pseudomonas aeruginosa TaxID=287 RepID=UPI00106C9EA0|nr:hypothetical protein [Pseudomonas aeruginosa]TQH35599.1 hypothetical protein FLI64_00975 [Pseudomonas aeruginosa]HBO4202891.1 hypothetical protein [Pseudomonas aeruginosa]HCD6605940.1 hypothetical protein [Pseudomonas aeruginosa]HCD7429477.1 hypothetical protein [Pseudomonas aeruginosa]HCD8079333.1 hypothetical protein [Pseudomonas aeruginosa]